MALRRDGHAEQWYNTFYIVRDLDSQVVGGCGFKGAPINRRVEIGYGVSPAHQNRGYATCAVERLLTLAFASGFVDEVLAQISDENLASARVVRKLGFMPAGTRRDEDNEFLVQWLARNAA